MLTDGKDYIPLHKPWIGEEEIAAANRVLRSGWLTTGVETRTFEQEFAQFVGTKHAVALNSCTAALHLALEAIGLQRGMRVLVPTHTFAATAEVVAYFGATPILVDVDPWTLNMDPGHAEHILSELAAGRAVPGVAEPGPVHAMIPVHFAGQMVDVDQLGLVARRHGLRVIEDSAHALPAWTRSATGVWRPIGTTAEQTCFSFYATKTITTGEGGMLTTDSEEIAARARRMSLHGLSQDAWKRFTNGGSWNYRILSTGYKYNLTDLASSMGRVQLGRAQALYEMRCKLAARYEELLGDVEELELPYVHPDRRPSWHLYVVRLRLDQLEIGRDEIVDQLRKAGIGASVHWMPLHLHPYYRETHGYQPEHLPTATREWERIFSLPIYPGLTDGEMERIAGTLREIVRQARRQRAVAAG